MGGQGRGGAASAAFRGFPPRGRFTPLHNIFFSALMPEINDIAELKATLHVFWTLYQKKGYPRFVTASELLADETLMRGMPAGGPAALRAALGAAVARGTLLHVRSDSKVGQEDLYFLNTEADQRTVARIRNGELELPGVTPAAAPAGSAAEKRNIFALYEANIGMLTPIIAEELKDAEKLYPQAWIEDAFGEAVALNKRNWRYVARILERWSAEGRNHGKPERHTQTTDPDKYVRGKYGHIVRRR